MLHDAENKGIRICVGRLEKRAPKFRCVCIFFFLGPSNNLLVVVQIQGIALLPSDSHSGTLFDLTFSIPRVLI